MYLRVVPEGAFNCGPGAFTIDGATNAAVAQVIIRMAPHHCEEQAKAVILKRLESDHRLLDVASQMKDMKIGYTIDSAPTKLPSGLWQIPFTAYIFDVDRYK